MEELKLKIELDYRYIYNDLKLDKCDLDNIKELIKDAIDVKISEVLLEQSMCEHASDFYQAITNTEIVASTKQIK